MMRLFLITALFFHKLNGGLCAIGRVIGVAALAAMVVAILIQVFFRYVLNNALPWPDEAARFLMLWMTGLMAPTAFRRGGFVAIDTFPSMLPKYLAGFLNLFILAICMVILVIAFQIGWKEVHGLGGRFASASLYLPTSFSFDSWYRLPRSWMMWSLVIGLGMLILVNVELVFRQVIGLTSSADRLPRIAMTDTQGAE